MGLIKCPECGREISDKANVCVGCGFPIREYMKKEEHENYLPPKDENDSDVPKADYEPYGENIVVCKSCGEKNNSDAQFCKKCGCSLGESNFKSNFVDVFEESGKIGKKNSVLSIFAAIFSIFGCMCYVGVILAIVDLCSKKRDRKHKLSVFAILACIVWTIVFIVIGSADDGNTDTQLPSTQIESQAETEGETEKVQETESKKVTEKSKNTEKTEKVQQKKKSKKHNKVVKALIKDGLDEKVAANTYSIMKKKIGFKKLEYEKKADGLDMYYIDADGFDVAITASDKVYRIFIPESSFVFYEDGKVKLTAKRLKETTIDQNEGSSYYIIAQEIVKQALLNPRGAKFPSYTFNSDAVAMQKDGDLVAVQSYVDATNGYGATIRTKWTVQFKVIDLDSFSYDLKYVKVGDDSTGTFEKMNE